MNDATEMHIRAWRRSMEAHVGLDIGDVDELEDHLRVEIANVEARGPRPDELVAVAAGRLGDGARIAEDMRLVRPESIWIARLRWALLGYLGYIATMWTLTATVCVSLRSPSETCSSTR